MAKWIIDKDHASITFSVKHLGVSWVKGYFGEFTADIEIDEQNPESGKIEAEIHIASISTNNESRDKHLKSPDFFDVQNHPIARFRSTVIQKTEAGKYKITGELSIRDIAKKIMLNGTLLGMRSVPSSDGKSHETRAGFSATTTINRHDFGVSWDAPAGDGATMAGADVEVTVNVEAIKQ